jgi:diguanylate cyclase (GGDEF)-like protein
VAPSLHSAPRTTLRRLTADPHVLLAIGLAVAGSVETVLVSPAEAGLGIGGGLTLVLAQVVIGVSRPPTLLERPSTRNSVRLLGALLYVAALHADLSGTSRVVSALYLPIVALAAAMGRREAILAGLVAMITWAVPLAVVNVISDRATLGHGVSMAVVATILVVGARRTVTALEAALRRVRHLAAADRRRGAVLAALDDVSRLLAAEGPSPAALEAIIGLFVRRLGHRYVAIYLGPPERMLLGAQAGYPSAIARLDPTRGVVGRAVRSAELQFVPDVAADPDYWAIDATVRSEICAPLVTDGSVVGLVNVEAVERLGPQDVAAIRLVADRLSTALALSRERESLARRATVSGRLVAFGSAVAAALDRPTLHERIVSAASEAVGAAGVTLAVRDEPQGGYRVVAGTGFGRAMVGATIDGGPSATGRALASGEMVIQHDYARAEFHPAIRDAVPFDMASIAVVPLLRDGLVRGAVTIGRPADQPFDEHDHEALRIMAGQAVLALANADLHAEVTEASLRDPLTGLYNRRFLDATLERLEAARARQLPTERPTVSAILFDLDHFGLVNKRHGHHVGDEVLRGFAGVLHGRVRASDIVARYGGEEFLVVLDGARTPAALAVADLIRQRFGALVFEGADGPLSVTVSAGVATTQPEEAIADAVARADTALAMAKRGGRDQAVAG